jgi:hypothetical protein
MLVLKLVVEHRRSQRKLISYLKCSRHRHDDWLLFLRSSLRLENLRSCFSENEIIFSGNKNAVQAYWRYSWQQKKVYLLKNHYLIIG